jgi:plastocyanin
MSRARAATSSALFAVAVLAVTACGGSGTASPGAASPSAAASPAASASADAAPSTAASPSASASAAASSAASPGASATGEQIQVVGVEYAFQNVPATTPVGTTFAFSNGGQEVHEMLVVRRGEGVTQSWEELLALPQDQVGNLATVVGNAFAEPGKAGEGAVTVDQAGDYLMVCFIPTGTKSLPTDANATLAPGAPHFTHGMLQEFTVTE